MTKNNRSLKAKPVPASTEKNPDEQCQEFSSSLARAFTRLEIFTKELAGYPPNMCPDEVMFQRRDIENELEYIQNYLAENRPDGDMPDVLKATLSNALEVLSGTAR